MQFKVPQFIDIEDKLFGPFTFKQFAYLAGGAGACFVIYRMLNIWLAILLIIPVAGLSLLMTFYKVNGQPFLYYLQASISYAMKSKLYIWKQKMHKKNPTQETPSVKESMLPTMTESKIRDLAWSLDILDKNKNNTK